MSKNLHFLKVVSQRFWSKVLKFFSFFLGSFLQEKVFRDDLYRKVAFFDHKNIDLNTLQNLHFLQVVSPWFW